MGIIAEECTRNDSNDSTCIRACVSSGGAITIILISKRSAFLCTRIYVTVNFSKHGRFRINNSAFVFVVLTWEASCFAVFRKR